MVVGRQHDDSSSVGVLLGFRIELILKADRLSKCIDLVGLAGKEVPAPISVGAAIALHHVALFFSGHLGGFTWIEAHGNYVKILAQVES